MKKINLFLIAATLWAYSFGQGIEFSEILNWTGTGDKVAMLIIDFNDGTDSTDIESYAFGYRFDSTKTAENMINDIAFANPELSVSATVFLSDIIYKTHEGIGGNPNWWATFTHTNSDWESNLGIGETLLDSMIFGCSYTETDTNWVPINKPENPIPASPSTASIEKISKESLKIYPNPSVDFIIIETTEIINKIEVFNLSGSLIHKQIADSKNINLNIENFKSGTYLIKVFSDNNIVSSLINKL